jgi:mono/diheme cytochrome c family protein
MKHHVSPTSLRSLLLLASALLLEGAGCGGKAAPPPTAPSEEASPAAQTTAQIERGKQLYVANCARCHGDAGQGTDKAPPVVGPEAFPLQPREGAERDVEFHTAADVFAWASEHMPGDAPGSLTTDEYLAIFAFDLTANGIELKAPLDAAAAQAIVLHP